MQRPPRFLAWPWVVEIHDFVVARYGGMGGIRDQGSLESAVHHARSVFDYQGGDLADLAATYMYHIIKNHPFLDGNKRTGFMAASVFLQLNDVPPIYSSSLEVAAVAVADHATQMSKEQLAVIIRRLIRLAMRRRRQKPPAVWGERRR